MTDADSYRDRKIAFVSNLTGTTPVDVTLHSLYVCLVLVTNRVIYRRANVSQNNKVAYTILNFVTIASPLILGVTFFADYIGLCCGICLVAIFAAVFLLSDKDAKSKYDIWKLDASSCVSAALTDNRYVLFYGTAVAILAVDFTIFPRRLAKTELYGFSVMDVGVGLFGLYYGFFAREIRAPPRFLDVKNFFKALWSTAPLCIIAFGRLIAVKLSGYPEHVTEYGVHWNFFFTLAFVRIGVSFVLLFFPYPRYVGFLSIALFIIYSIAALNSASFSYWLMNTPDDRRSLSLIEQNKEGVVSLPGFLAIYLLGMQLGSLLQPILFKAKEKLPFYDCFLCMVKLLVGAMLSAGLCAFSHIYVQPCSRRLANLAYIFWLFYNFLLMMSTCLFGALLAVILDARKRAAKPSDNETDLLLPRAFNYNTLALFLLANILTGLVNISMETVSVSPAVAFAVVTTYCFAVSSIASFLYCSKLTLKFW